MREWAIRAILVLAAILAPIQAVIISVGTLVALDMITGIWAAYKLKQPIKSSGLRRTVSKFLIYQIAIITGFIVEQYLIGGAMPITKMLGGLIGVVELKSILENANIINGTDLFKMIIERLGSVNDTTRKVADELKVNEK